MQTLISEPSATDKQAPRRTGIESIISPTDQPVIPRKLLPAGVLLLFGVGLAVMPAHLTHVDAKTKSDTFSAMAYLPTGAGPRMMGAEATANLTIYVERYVYLSEWRKSFNHFL